MTFSRGFVVFSLCTLLGAVGTLLVENWIERRKPLRSEVQPPIHSHSGHSTSDEDFAFIETFELPCGSVTVKSHVITAFPELEDSAWYRELTAEKRDATVREVFDIVGDHAGLWKIEATARTRGTFHIATTILASLARFYLADLKELPSQLRLPERLKTPLTIKVYDSAVALERSAPMWGERQGKNGYYDPQRNEIGIYIDPGLLNFLYPEKEFGITPEERVRQASDSLRRRILVPFYHEFAHALQNSSDALCFKSPFFAEGCAVYYASRLEREEALVPLISEEFIASAKRNPQKISDFTEQMQSSVRDLQTGRVLLPTEYMRISQVRAALKNPDGKLLANALTFTPSEFGGQDNSAISYDLSWVVINFLVQQGDRDQLATKLIDVSVNLSADANIEQLAALEQRLLQSLPKEISLHSAPSILSQSVQQADAHLMKGEPFKAVLAYKPVFDGFPSSVVNFSYFGDLFLNSGQRDLFFYYYEMALTHEGEGHKQRMSGKVRVVEHYVNALWELGHYQRAADWVSDYSITSLDLISVSAITLREHLLLQLMEAPNEPQRRQKLMKEFELGSCLIELHTLLSSRLIQSVIGPSEQNPPLSPESKQQMKDVVARGILALRTRIHKCMDELGYKTIPSRAWFLLEFQMADSPIDVQSLGIN